MKNQITKNLKTKNILNKNSNRGVGQYGHARSSDTSRTNDLIICGKHPAFSALQKQRRKIFEIFVTKNSLTELENFLKNQLLGKFSSLIRIVENQQIENLVGKEQIHQGFAIRASKLPIKNQNDLLEELYTFKEGTPLPRLILLDQISDPHNIGAIIRSAASFGVKKIIFCEHNAPRENATIVKSSAGTIELVDLFVVTNFNNLIEKLKKIGYWCIGLDGGATTKISEIKDYKNIALIIGSEGNGIRDLVKKNCDLLTKIEIDKEVESLNASVAASIALYQISQNDNL